MSEFLEILKERFVECQKRFQAKQAQLNAVNAEFQAVAQEFNSIQTLMNLEVRKQQMQQALTTQPSPALPAPQSNSSQDHPISSSDVNKTETIRELLRQHTSGMTPSEIWKQQIVRSQFPHRAYLYSVLKRLKDKGDIKDKGGKYYFKFVPKPEEKPEENRDQNVVQ